MFTSKKSVMLNQDKRIVSIVKDGLFSFFDSETFQELASDNEYENLIGKVKIAVPLFSSHIFFFVGSCDTGFTPNQLLIWDDFHLVKLAILQFESNIVTIAVNHIVFAVLLNNAILVYNTATLALVGEYGNFLAVPNSFTLSNVGLPIVMAMTNKNKASFSITLFFFNHSEGVIKTTKTRLHSKLNSVGCIRLSNEGELLAATNIEGNKIHVFCCKTLQTKFCITQNYKYNELSKLVFSKDNSFLLLHGTYESKVYIFALKKTEQIGDDSDCSCAESEDSDSELDSLENEALGYSRKKRPIVEYVSYRFVVDDYKEYKIERNKDSRTHFIFEQNNGLRIIDDSGIIEQIEMDFKTKKCRKVKSVIVEF